MAKAQTRTGKVGLMGVEKCHRGAQERETLSGWVGVRMGAPCESCTGQSGRDLNFWDWEAERKNDRAKAPRGNLLGVGALVSRIRKERSEKW